MDKRVIMRLRAALDVAAVRVLRVEARLPGRETTFLFRRRGRRIRLGGPVPRAWVPA